MFGILHFFKSNCQNLTLLLWLPSITLSPSLPSFLPSSLPSFLSLTSLSLCPYIVVVPILQRSGEYAHLAKPQGWHLWGTLVGLTLTPASRLLPFSSLLILSLLIPPHPSSSLLIILSLPISSLLIIPSHPFSSLKFWGSLNFLPLSLPHFASLIFVFGEIFSSLLPESYVIVSRCLKKKILPFPPPPSPSHSLYGSISHSPCSIPRMMTESTLDQSQETKVSL